LLSGSFEAFTRSAENEAQAASIQVLLLDDAEVRDFARGKPGSVTYSTEASTKQSVQWILNPNYKEGKKYFLVFSNLGSGPGTKLVSADFTVEAQ
jgi:hypothetical protein